MKDVHTVKVQLKGYPDRENKIWIDGQEIRNVTSFGLEAGIGKTGNVIIAFIANVQGEFEGAVNIMENPTAALPGDEVVR